MQSFAAVDLEAPSDTPDLELQSPSLSPFAPGPEATGTPLPSHVQIEPVGQCNLRCRMCPVQFRQDGPPHGPPALMPYETFCSLLDQFPQVTELHLQGLGEPTLHPRFVDMVRYAVGKGIRVTTNTNLTALSERRAQALIDSGLEWIRISIDGAQAGSYEDIRLGASFNRVLRNLQWLGEARQRSRRTTPRLYMVAVLMRRNLDELPELVRLAHRYGIEDLWVQHLCHDFGESALPAHYTPMREFVQDQMLTEADLARVEAVYAEARTVAAALGMPLRLPDLRPDRHAAGTPGRKRCGLPWESAYISFRGEAMPCCMIATPDRLNFGRMDQEGVMPVWNSGAFNDFRRRLESNDPPDICRSCSVYHGVF